MQSLTVEAVYLQQDLHLLNCCVVFHPPQSPFPSSVTHFCWRGQWPLGSLRQLLSWRPPHCQCHWWQVRRSLHGIFVSSPESVRHGFNQENTNSPYSQNRLSTSAFNSVHIQWVLVSRLHNIKFLCFVFFVIHRCVLWTTFHIMPFTTTGRLSQVSLQSKHKFNNVIHFYTTSICVTVFPCILQ